MGRVVTLLVIGGLAGFFVGWAVAVVVASPSVAALQSIGAVVGAIIGGQAGYRWRNRAHDDGHS